MSCFVLETRDLQSAFFNPYQTQNSIEHALSEESLIPPIQSICPEPTGPSGPNCHSLGPSRSVLIYKCPSPNISKLITCKGQAPSSRHTTRALSTKSFVGDRSDQLFRDLPIGAIHRRHVTFTDKLIPMQIWDILNIKQFV